MMKAKGRIQTEERRNKRHHATGGNKYFSSLILQHSSSGFTLLEIMIALAIIGTALTVIVHTVNYHTNIMYENTLTTRMFQLAKEKMNELETAPLNSSGQIDSTGLSYENTATPIKDTRLVELKTVVKGQGRQVVLNQLVINKTE